MMGSCKKKAIEYFDKVINQNKKDETYYRTWHQKILLYAKNGKSEECIVVQTKILESNMDTPKQWTLLIAAYYETENDEKAYEWAIKAIKKFPKESLICVYASDICRRIERYKEAFDY